MIGSRRRTGVALAAILTLALAVRLAGVAWGLPALYDPDEPLFMLCALKLLREGTLDPGWFGHPGTTTIYGIAVVEVLTYVGGHVAGLFASPGAFVRAIYLDPALVWLPARLLIVACSVGCVGLTYHVGARAFDPRIGLVAAGVLAVDALHVQWSQVVRTDVMASLFMLLSVLAALRVAAHGRWRDYLWAGALAGIATATKWPAATVVAALVAAAALRAGEVPAERRTTALRLAAGIAALPAALLLASPYLLLDWHTVVTDLGGEVATQHLGATGGSPWFNLRWYVAGPLRAAYGVAGLLAIAAGSLIAVRRTRRGWVAIVAPAGLFVAMICTQSLVWTRWIVPVLPFAALAVGVALVAAADALRARLPRLGSVAAALVAAVLLVPMLAATARQVGERQDDTRSQATRWLTAHAAPGTPVAAEHIAIDLIFAGHPLLFPMGRAGCVDGMAFLTGHTSFAHVGKVRGPVDKANFGTLPPVVRATCAAPFVVLSDYDRYLAEADRFPAEVAAYEAIRRAGTEVAVFRPVAGRVGGPVVRLIRSGEPPRPFSHIPVKAKLVSGPGALPAP